MANTYTYTGDAPRTYPTYLDVTDPAKPPKTLDAEPGKTYAIRPAAGHALPDEDGDLQPADLPVPPDDGLWKAGKSTSTSKKDGD